MRKSFGYDGNEILTADIVHGLNDLTLTRKALGFYGMKENEIEYLVSSGFLQVVEIKVKNVCRNI